MLGDGVGHVWYYQFILSMTVHGKLTLSISGACGGCSVSSGASLFPVQMFDTGLASQPLLTSAVQSRHLSFFGHIANGHPPVQM